LDVLIIGGTRFVGYSLTWRLLAAGHRVTLFNRGLNGDPFDQRVKRLVGDRTTEAFSHLLLGQSFDAVVDFAAFRPSDVQSAIEVLADRVGHYVFISTGQVYLVRAECPTPAREKDYAGRLIPRPADPGEVREWEYGVGKRGCEDALEEAWGRERFPATRLRIPMVNGERDYHRRLESYLWRLLDGGPLLLPQEGGPMRHVYGGEVARAVATLLGQSSTFGQAFNFAQEETPTLGELLRILAELLGAPARLLPVPTCELESAGLPAAAFSPFSASWMSFLDPSRAREELGLRHEPLRQYLDKIVTSFLTHPPKAPPENYALRERERKLAAGYSKR